MEQQVIINDYSIETEHLHRSKASNGLRKISFDFQVDHEEYHAITTLLYTNDFIVEIPEKNIRFPAVIQSYSTSITNLYKEGAVGRFVLKLVEKNIK